MNITREMVLRREREKLNNWKAELKQLPEGSLYCVRRFEKVYFYHAIAGRRLGITNNEELVYKLARKKYLKYLILEHSGSIRRSIENGTSTSGYSGNLLEYYKKMNMDIARITCTVKQYSWMKMPYVQNPTYRDQLIYETFSGTKVRTKSEHIIANALESRGIPYRYEQGLSIPVDWMEGVNGTEDGINKPYYPDFTIRTSTDKYIIWEHLGRVDLESYRAHNMEKISAYRQGGEFADSQLILTFEQDLRSINSLYEIIDQRILPYM